MEHLIRSLASTLAIVEDNDVTGSTINLNVVVGKPGKGKAAWTWFARKIAKSRGVVGGSGPSSRVRATLGWGFRQNKPQPN
ncbi:MAG: hypothetical protein KGQ93_12780 [Cyanobacteria bacterium REEB459]|nr:hypothetical protein [Cyanobacteria bacterium REEB459]